MSGQSNAVSLGEVQVNSALGEPVRMRISLLEWDDIDKDRLQVSLASPDEFDNFGLVYLPVLNDLEIAVGEPGVDNIIPIQISSTEGMNEPYLEMLIRLRWPGGSFMREYVVLFDPPAATESAENEPSTVFVRRTNSRDSEQDLAREQALGAENLQQLRRPVPRVNLERPDLSTHLAIAVDNVNGANSTANSRLFDTGHESYSP